MRDNDLYGDLGYVYNYLERNPLNSVCVSLWVGLLFSWYENGCVDGFSVSTEVLCTFTQACRVSVNKARNKLVENGVIECHYWGGNRGYVYKILELGGYKFGGKMLVGDKLLEGNFLRGASNKDSNSIKKSKSISKKSTSNFGKICSGDLVVEGCIRYFEERVGEINLRIATEIKGFLRQGLEDKLIFGAIDRSLDKRAENTWAYARKILESCVGLGNLTLEKLEIAEKAFYEGKNKVVKKDVRKNVEKKYKSGGSFFD